MTALVVIPNGRHGDGQRPLRGRRHKLEFQGLGEIPGHHVSRIPIDNGPQIKVAVLEPHGVGVGRRHPLPSVRINRVPGLLGRTRMRPRRNAFNPHLVHITLNPLTADGMDLPL